MSLFALVLFDIILLLTILAGYEGVNGWLTTDPGLVFLSLWRVSWICVVTCAFLGWWKAWPKQRNRYLTRLLALLILSVTVIWFLPLGWYLIGYIITYHLIWYEKPEDLPLGLALLFLPFWWNVPLMRQNRIGGRAQ